MLAAAEAFAYGADLVLAIDPADVAALGEALSFLRGGAGAGAARRRGHRRRRRRLAAHGRGDEPARAPQPAVPAGGAAGSRELPLVVELGTPAYPQAEAANPDAFALKVRARSSATSAARCGSTAARSCWRASPATRAGGGCSSLNYGGPQRSRACACGCAGSGRRGEALRAGQGEVAVEAPLVQDERDRVLAAAARALCGRRPDRGALSRRQSHAARSAAPRRPPRAGRSRPTSGAAADAPRTRAPPQPLHEEHVVERVARRARLASRRRRSATPWTGQPVRGSMMCEYVTPSFTKKRRSRPRR